MGIKMKMKMKMNGKMVAATILSICLLCGCTKSTIINPVDTSDLPMPGPDGIVWEQLWDDWTETYTDPDFYPFADSVNGSIYPDEGVARFFLLLNRDISLEEAKAYAMEVIKGFGYLIAEQNSDYTHPDETSYGSYLEAYDIYVMVGSDATKADESTWILEDTIPAGEYREIGETGEAGETDGAGETD